MLHAGQLYSSPAGAGAAAAACVPPPAAGGRWVVNLAANSICRVPNVFTTTKLTASGSPCTAGGASHHGCCCCCSNCDSNLLRTPPQSEQQHPASESLQLNACDTFVLHIAGQGLPLPGKPGLAARDYSRVRTWAAEGAAWRASYAADPGSVCNPRSGLCAANPGSEDFGKLLVATSPADYDARTASASFDPITPVQDQRPCQSAVAFAVITAAEAAVASALHVNATSVSLSQQDLQFCPDAQRTCQDTWDVRAAVDRLINSSIVSYDCLPYTAATTDDPAKLCNYRCKDQPKQLQGGRFRAVAVRSPMEGQRHIRRYGSFVTRFTIYQVRS